MMKKRMRRENGVREEKVIRKLRENFIRGKKNKTKAKRREYIIKLKKKINV